MNRYDVLSPIKVKGKRIAPGESVEIDGKRAEELLALGAIAPVGGSKSEAKEPPTEDGGHATGNRAKTGTRQTNGRAK